MRITIWSSSHADTSTVGPYKLLDTVELPNPYSVGDMTHYGEVVLIAPPIPPFTDDADQAVMVKLIPSKLSSRPEESIQEPEPTSYDRIKFFPIHVDRFGYWTSQPPKGSYSILAGENLTIEDVSPLITSDTFSVWKTGCYLSSDTMKALEGMGYAIVHRYSTKTRQQDAKINQRSTELIDMTALCLALIRPTRRSRAGKVTGIIKANGVFDPEGFDVPLEPAEVPEVQQLFTVENRDINLLRSVLPEFVQLYQRDEEGELKDEYEPIRIAAQLYEQAYAITYWKARHILWWSAIEALYGSNEDTAMARIYALFGKKKLVDGYHHSIYEEGDIPSCYNPSSYSNHTLGETVPLIYAVRNSSAHGQKVPDSHFEQVPHPLGNAVRSIEVLAEAATLIVRRTIIEILQRGFRERFKDRKSRDQFWLLEYGLDHKQSRKRLSAELKGLHKLKGKRP